MFNPTIATVEYNKYNDVIKKYADKLVSDNPLIDSINKKIIFGLDEGYKRKS